MAKRTLTTIEFAKDCDNITKKLETEYEGHIKLFIDALDPKRTEKLGKLIKNIKEKNSKVQKLIVGKDEPDANEVEIASAEFIFAVNIFDSFLDELNKEITTNKDTTYPNLSYADGKINDEIMAHDKVYCVILNLEEIIPLCDLVAGKRNEKFCFVDEVGRKYKSTGVLLRDFKEIVVTFPIAESAVLFFQELKPKVDSISIETIKTSDLKTKPNEEA